MASHQNTIKLFRIVSAIVSLSLLMVSQVFAQTATIRFSFSAYTVNEASGMAFVSVARSGNTTSQVSVDYSTSNGTAVDGLDYNGVSGTLIFLSGETNKIISVPILDDVLNEYNETISLTLSNPGAGVVLGTPNTATLIIIDDDPAPNVYINDVAVTEGNSGTVDAVFTVSLSAQSGKTVFVDYGVGGVTASAGSDFLPSSKTLSFLPGETGKTISVTVNGDILNEADETYNVVLSGAVNANFTKSIGVGTILNDDPAPTISINNVSVLEGNSGTTSANFTIALSAVSGQTITVNYATANGTAVAGTDYVAASGTVTLAPGETSNTITVLVNGNTIYQLDKTFFVNLSAASNATIATPQSTGTILNDDVCPVITLAPASLPNGNIGSAYNQTVSASGGTAPYAFTVSSGTLPAGLTLSGGVLSGTPTAAGPATFTVTATDANGCMGSISYTLVVNQIPSISINDIAVTEFNKGTVNAVFTVTLSLATPLPVTINYATANGTATAGVDYTAASGTLTFAPGTTTQTITVLVNGDRKKETNETFTVGLSTPVNGTIGTGTGTCTIVNDDLLPKIHINNENIAEGNNGTKQMLFTVSISKKWDAPVTVQYATADGTAQAGSDYIAASGTVTFAPGENKKTIAVTINGDAVYEPDKQFVVNLSNPTNGKMDNDQARGTIQNDDQKPKNALGSTASTDASLVPAKDETTVQVPTEFTLSQNYPNPFNPSTTIRYTVAAPTNVKLQIYNALGEVVATLVDREQAAGTYQFQWQANLPSGVYFYRLVAGNFVDIKRMILMK